MSIDIETGDILNALGQHLYEILEKHPDGAFLFIEVDGQSTEAAIFFDEGPQVVYYDPDEELLDEIQTLWNLAEAGKKWSVLEYDVHDNNFDAKFTYQDQLDPEEDIYDRRERLLQLRYGGKPVIYPPPTADMVEITLADLAHLDDDKDKV